MWTTQITESQHPAGTSSGNLFQYRSRKILGHTILSVFGFLVFMLLNCPAVILLTRLGVTAWYPAVGFAFALMLGVSPLYMPVFAVAGSAAGMLIYHQPFYSWGTLVGGPLEMAAYGIAAYLLRGPVEIDSSLGQRRDVMRYLLVAPAATIFATLTGVLCLWGDHTIQGNEFWASALVWYIGDTIGLLSVAPFLLIHVAPWLSRWGMTSEASRSSTRPAKSNTGYTTIQILELTAQAASFLLLFWVMFRTSGSEPLFYPAFLPVIWIGMRRGIRGAVIGLLALNFGIVVSLRLVSVPPEVFTKLGLLMLAVSATGLILGAAVSERKRIADDLKERTIFLNSLIENSPFGIVVQDRHGRIQLCNQAFTNLFLFDHSELVGKNLKDLIAPADLRAEVERHTGEVGSGKSLHSCVRRARKDGRIVDVEMHAVPLVKDGRIKGGYVIYKDITEQVNASIAAKEHEEQMNRWVGELELRTMQITLLNEMGGLLQCAESSEEAYAVVSEAARKLFAGAAAGALFIHKSSRHSLEIAASWGTSCAGEQVFEPVDCWSVRKGQPHWSECLTPSVICPHVDKSIDANYLCVPMVANGGTLGVLHLQCHPDTGADTEADQKSRESLKRLAVAAASQIALFLVNMHLRETLREQSIRDPLTGLFNRRFLQESLERELQRAKRKQRSLAIIFLDVDRFKHFNDIFGHDAGDAVLQSMAHLFRTQFRTEDVICRYGGEEFAAILPETSLQDAANRAEALRLAMKDLRLVHRGVLLDPVTISIGIAGFPDHGQSSQELLERADKGLYRSKTDGRDRVTLAST
jgi:diguanylate cyclase (GGDEF)-like protein/PAS domain S-box-containing protein